MPKLEAYKKQWANYTGPQSQAEGYHREVAVQRVEQQLQREGQAFIDGERDRLAKRAGTLSQSYADIQAAARAITQACKSRIVDVEEVADQLDELEKQARKNREAIARIEEQQDRNEERDPLSVAEHLYDKYPMLISPADQLPAFRTDSEQSGPALRGSAHPSPNPGASRRGTL